MDLCPLCAAKYGVNGAWCVGERSGVLEKVIDAYKFDRTKAAHRTLAALVCERLPLLPASTVITSIPTASAHMRVRGYDHAALLGRTVAGMVSLPFRELLHRESGLTQHFASRQERRRQSDSAFSSRGYAPSVLLIDDIATTGFTLQAAVRRLREAGCDHVYIAIVARQPSRREP